MTMQHTSGYVSGGDQARSYQIRRGELEVYFDRTASEAWSRLTSDAPVSGIRATVRAGRDRMRATLLSCLPADMRGQTLLDAGCGTGALAVEAARRGAHVTAIDLSATLVQIAQERLPRDLGQGGDLGQGNVTFHVGDMLDPALGTFDHVVGMDSLIHYAPEDATSVLAAFAARTRHSINVTFAPKTPLLAAMHTAGKLFPRGDRSPAIVPTGEAHLRRLIAANPGLSDWTVARTERIKSGFYTSQALQLRNGKALEGITG